MSALKYREEHTKFYHNELQLINSQQCRIHCFTDPINIYWREHLNSRQLKAIEVKQEILTQEQIATLIILPHVIVTSSSPTSSLFLKFFNNAPPGGISFSNVTIQQSDESNPPSSPPRSFSSNAELSDYLNDCAVGSQKLRISGTLCGDVVFLASLSYLSGFHFTFECSVLPFYTSSSSPSSSLNVNHLMTLTKIARCINDDDLLSNEMKTGNLTRPQSARSMWHEKQEKRSKIEHPELHCQKRQKLMETQWSELSSHQLTAVELEYQQQIERCDQHDSAVKQRWIERVHSNSPGIRPVIMTVDDDDSVVVNARL